MLDPAKDYSSQLHVETSVEYDLPAHIYPPKGSEPILMIHPAYLRKSRIASNTSTSNPSNLVTSQFISSSSSSLQLPQVQQSISRSSRKSTCSCGNLSCSINGVQSLNAQRNSVNNSSARTLQQQIRDGELYVPNRTLSSLAQKKQLSNSEDHSRQLQQSIWTSSRCMNVCCNPRAAAMAPVSEFATPGLPPSLLARTPTRGTSGSSPKLRTTGGRTRRGINLANSVHLPEYLGSSRPSRISIAAAAHVHPRPRAMSTVGALAAAPAPPMGHQTMGVSLTTSLDLARANPLSSRTVYTTTQNQLSQQSQQTTTSLLSTVGLSRDSGCSVSTGDTSMTSTSSASGIDWSNEWPGSDWSRSLVDSGFCTPVDFTTSDDSLLSGGKISLIKIL